MSTPPPAATPMAWPNFSAGEDPVETLIKLSRFYGCDPAFVLAGGGNTSVKIGERLYVKASGTALATIDRSGFVILDRQKLNEIADADFGTEVESREAQYKTAIMNARLEISGGGPRPSVESLLHHLVPGRFVVHTHATLVNALTCSIRGVQLAQECLGDACLWVEFVDPGYTLGRVLKENLARYRAQHGGNTPGPKAIIMANHGMIVGGDTPEEVRANTDFVVAGVAAKLGGGTRWQSAGWGMPIQTPLSRTDAAVLRGTLESALQTLLRGPEVGAPVVAFDDSPLIWAFVNSALGHKAALGGPLNPDQIVYCTSFPLWFEPRNGEEPAAVVARLREQWAGHKRQYKYDPRIILVPGLGLLATGESASTAQTALQLYRDTIQVMSGAILLGGIQPLSAAKREFIENWEVEAYRRQIAKKGM